MTFKEAHESGRNYRRKSALRYNDPAYYRYDAEKIHVQDAVANDYELEPIPEKTVIINKRDLIDGLKACGLNPTDGHSHALLGWAHNLVEELGLGE